MVVIFVLGNPEPLTVSHSFPKTLRRVAKKMVGSEFEWVVQGEIGRRESSNGYRDGVFMFLAQGRSAYTKASIFATLRRDGFGATGRSTLANVFAQRVKTVSGK